MVNILHSHCIVFLFVLFFGFCLNLFLQFQFSSFALLLYFHIVFHAIGLHTVYTWKYNNSDIYLFVSLLQICVLIRLCFWIDHIYQLLLLFFVKEIYCIISDFVLCFWMRNIFICLAVISFYVWLIYVLIGLSVWALVRKPQIGATKINNLFFVWQFKLKTC